MTDNTFGYSNGGLSQSLNGITSITDGSGASITDGNAIFIDTTTNTATINNNLTIPLSSIITLYGNIFIPAYNITLTPDDIINIGNITGITYNLPTNTTSILGNSVFGSSGALAEYTTMRINSDVLLYGNINLPTFSSIITPTILSYLDATSSIQSQFDDINTYFNAYISWFEIILGFPPNETYINMIENIRMTKKLTIKNGITLESTGINYTLTNQILSYVDPTSSIQSQFNNITTNYLTKVLAQSTYATITTLNNYTPLKATVSANATTGIFYLVLTNNNTGGASNLSIGLPSYDANNKILKSINNIDAGASTNATIYNSITTGSITIGGGLTNGTIKIGVNTQTGSIQLGSLNNSITMSGNNIVIGYSEANPISIIGDISVNGNATFNNTITGTTTNTLSVKTSDITSGVYRVVLTESGYPSSLNASLMTDSEGLNFDADNKILYSNTFHGDLDGVATTANNIKVDEDITSTTLYLPLITTSINTPSTGVKVNNVLRYNTVTNALTTTTFIGNLTGNCSGSSSSCTGNSARSTNVAFTSDNTSISLCVALTAATATTTSAALRLDTNLRFNASTNALTTTSFIGNLVGNVNGNLNGNILGNSNLDYTIHPSNASNISIGNPNGDGLINVYGEQIQLAGQLVTRRDIVMQSEAYCPFNIKTIFSTATLQSPFSKYIVCNFSIAGFIYMPYPEFAHYGMEIIVRNVGSAAAIVSNSTGNNVFLNLSNTPTSTLSGLVAISMVCIIHPSGVGYIWAQI